MISVVIPAYNNASDVETLLASLVQCCPQLEQCEVIVVDDGSPNDSFQRVSTGYPFVRLLTLPSNRGAAAARNAGVRIARHDVLLFLDSDMVVQSDATRIVLDIFQDPQVAAAVGAVSAEPMNPGWFKRFWGLVKAFSLPRGGYSSTFYPMVGAIRKRVFQDVGGFDEHIKGASVEDYEFSLRLGARGYRVHYHPALLVRTHYKDMITSLGQSFSRAAKWTVLFSRRKRFDNHTTTSAQALSALCGACLIGSAFLLLLGRGSVLLTIGLLGAYLSLNSQFLRYVAATAGLRFVPAAVFFHLILSLVVTLGVARAGVQLLSGAKRSQALLYNS